MIVSLLALAAMGLDQVMPTTISSMRPQVAQLLRESRIGDEPSGGRPRPTASAVDWVERSAVLTGPRRSCARRTAPGSSG